MITLATLPQATEQEVFDQVARHLLMQKQQCSAGESNCRYQLNGLKCAAGCLIGEDEYDPCFEGSRWSKLVERELIPSAHKELIEKLQSIHDTRSVDWWRQHLATLALEWSLDRSVLDKPI